MSTITTINDSDLITDSNEVINTNFSNLNTDKVEGQSASIDSEIALFSGTGGKTIKRASTTGLLKATAGVISAAVSNTDYAAANKGVTNGDSHDHSGGDGAAITEAAITLADNTTNDVSSAKHGFAPKGDGSTTKFLNANGAYSTPTSSITETWIFPGQGALTGATLGEAPASSSGIIPAVLFDDANTDIWRTSTIVPTGKTGISSILVYYLKSGAAGGDLRLVFTSASLDLDTLGADDTQDASDTLTTYTNANTELDTVTVPSGAYNGVSIAAGDLFALRIERQGGDGSDTFTSDWAVIGVKITWS